MHGTGVPLVTPFDRDGAVDESALRELVGWLTDRGVDLLVPCGSTSEAPLMTVAERARVVEVVVEAAPADVPVLAGTGHAGLAETAEQTRLAAAAGADGALVVTPFYYPHDDDALAAYYREVADRSDLPVYLYSVPPFTGVTLSPAVVERVSAHGNVAGMKDSSGDLEALQRERRLAADGFELFVGAGSVYGHALDCGADGGILGLANVVPERASEVYRLHRDGDGAAARGLTADLVELNRTALGEHGVPGVKAAMRARGAPAGFARSPHRPVDAGRDLERLVEDALA